MASIYDWSTTFANNGTSDGDVPWPEGMARRQVNDSARGIMGRVAALIGDIGGALSAGGTANGLTVTANSAFTTYADGRIIAFRATADNTGAATLSVNAIGAKAIRKMDTTGDVALVAGDIQQTGVYIAQYSAALNGAAGAWLLVNPTLPQSLVGGAATSTDNAVARFDGTGGRTIQNSTVTVSDTGVFSGGAWNGTVGATTPAAGTFTTGSFSGAVSISGTLTGAAYTGTSLALSSAAPDINFTDTDTNADSRISANSAVGGLLIQADVNNEVASSTIIFQVDGSTRFTIDAAGEVTAHGNIYKASGVSAVLQPGSNGNVILRPNPGVSTNDTTINSTGDMTVSGDVTAASDERLKTDWADLPEDFIERLAGVKTGTFTRIDTGSRQVGVGAQSLQPVLPEAVMDNEGTLSVAYGQAALVACVCLAQEVIRLRKALK